jgi:predicted nucleic acid-binding protein
VADHPRLEARDLIHFAVMRRFGVTRIISADRGFDGVPGIERLDPKRLAEWRDSVIA